MAQSPPSVDVLIPCYNHAAYIEACLESVFAQSYPALSVVVIDDGSTDNSAEVLEQLSARWPFRWSTRPNKGLTATLNEGLEQCKGEFLIVLASDDAMTPGRIASQVKHLKENEDWGLVCGDIQEFYDSGETQRRISYPFQSGYVADMLLRKSSYILAPSVMMRRSALDSTGGYDESLTFEDYDKFVHLALEFPLGYISEVWAMYRIHETNLHGNTLRTYEQGIAVLEKYKDRLPLFSEYRSAHALIAFRSLASTKGNKLNALQMLPRAWRHVFTEGFWRGCLNLLIRW